MRSLADASPARRARMIAELLLRFALILSLAAAVYLSLSAMNERPSTSVRGDESTVRDALRDWSTSYSPRDAHVEFDSMPSPVTRAWAAALRAAGTSLTWSSSLPAIAVAIEPIADPKGASRVLVSAPRGNRIALHDSLGLIDTVAVGNVGASAGPLQLHGPVGAAVARSTAVSARTDSLVVRPVLVLGRAGWEGKFVATALEEYGWRVNARLSVSPGNEVTQGASAAPIDTSNYAAVVVIDSSPSRYAPAITRYVRSGGGLVVLGEGNTLLDLQALLPAQATPPSPPGIFTQMKPRDALALRSLVNLKTDAIALERRGNRVAIAARRAGSGRVVQVGYDDVWRWRMAGPGDAVEEHRNWLSSVTSAAAYAPRVPLAAAPSDPAPTAAIFTSLGAPADRRSVPSSGNTHNFLLALFVIALVAMVAETASRRLDGRP